ncbi:MAG TPA: AMP-binding protein, partial [Polyangiales bacterium]|nr:AMP-binding protein [Polyangiales bacterium]
MSDRHLSSWPPSAPRDLDPPRTSLWMNVENAVKANPDRRAIVFYDSTLTYSEFQRECERMAGYLTEVCGVKKGDRVGVYMQNSPQFVIAY